MIGPREWYPVEHPLVPAVAEIVAMPMPMPGKVLAKVQSRILHIFQCDRLSSIAEYSSKFRGRGTVSF